MFQIDVTAMEKPERTKIHQMIKECFKSVSSTTVEIDGKKFIKCLKQTKKGMYCSRIRILLHFFYLTPHLLYIYFVAKVMVEHVGYGHMNILTF